MKNAGRFVRIRLTHAEANACGLAFGLASQWSVPRGFGEAFREHALHFPPTDVLRDRLELIGYTAKLEAIAAWPAYRRVEADLYACRVHLRASDNPVPVPPRPMWFPEPWRGQSRDPILNPSPTPIVGGAR